MSVSAQLQVEVLLQVCAGISLSVSVHLSVIVRASSYICGGVRVSVSVSQHVGTGGVIL